MNSSQSHDKDSTHFGYREVSADDKAGLVGDVFHSVASKYDIMNDLMSFGAHRLWKRFAVDQSDVRTGNRVLDVAAGSGDLSRQFARKVGPAGQVIVTDINSSMLAEGRSNLIDQGFVSNVNYALVDAEQLCFVDNYFDCVAISFGLRNVTRIDRALASMNRVLKPGGRLLILEFSKPRSKLLDKVYDLYSFNAIPAIGKLVTGDQESYQYLVESIRKHPDQETLKGMMIDAGFDAVRVHNLNGGIVALHIGFKY